MAVALVGILLFSATALTSRPSQPEPARPGIAAPEIEDAYRVVQVDPSASDQDRVRSAVDTYFTLKCESRVRGEALDLSIVVDVLSPKGKALHDYELGRLQYCLRAWKLGGLAFSAYDYRPVYDSVAITGDTATVAVQPWVDLTYADTPEPDVACEPHTLTLVRATDGWKIIEDEYQDEFLLKHPRGTDFAVLEARLSQDLAATKARWEALDRKLREDPRTRYRYQKGAGESAGILGYRTYSRTAAATYGMTWTDNSGSTSHDPYNQLFIGYDLDCINFVCQCTWSGFGGDEDDEAGYRGPRPADGRQRQRGDLLVVRL
jgi:hypothetical protein